MGGCLKKNEKFQVLKNTNDPVCLHVGGICLTKKTYVQNKKNIISPQKKMSEGLVTPGITIVLGEK